MQGLRKTRLILAGLLPVLAGVPAYAEEDTVPTMTACEYEVQSAAGTAKITYWPDEGHKKPIYVAWEHRLTNDQGTVVLRGWWQSGNYLQSFSEQAQFNIFITPKKRGPKLARVEIHPWAYRYNHWGMTFGATSQRSDNNTYYASGFWPILRDLEGRADKLLVRVQKITSDTANNNHISNSVISLDVPEGLFQRADQLVVQAVDEGNAAMADGTIDCKQVPSPPIIVT
ncbi:hypothetical protein HKD42_06180 [Altererythrobacter sp. RZ02]|uniref:Uncharacterized protein n=1 Tax=Pontixanthobacter rizhaonensis TaxID=2730337 RepID=A0A848QLV3_9SPHN|nr:hypothetical protein [Pontixanthobacter rizhaonensis]NMW31643.1 hypothetical protein [Pontixanthobacter rizhaonensis]